MKKILAILGTITLIATSTTSLVACDNIVEYTPEKLKELKEKNKINTANQEIRDNLEWIAKHEKPFSEVVDNKWYYIIYKDNSNNIKLSKRLNNNRYTNIALPWSPLWIKVYRWNLDTQEPDLIIDDKGNLKVNGE
ncbi:MULTISPECIES: lipoprotein [unclassified Spiroplasma]|uniref:lipoprotein n=1 Tax=unclassified Spiroplasma TaxID=2637901 RepID=UPI0030CC3532